ncbi:MULTISPECIES: YciI family protein [Actinomadura]|uniref:YciI family protein n=1 Tax=Actinomadura miaoliensis TaxID=430685 RepID=A0ABP7WMU6_9ACTN
MKYLLLIYSNPESVRSPVSPPDPELLAVPADEREELTAQFEALRKEITESGELVAGAALGDPLSTRTTRVRGGVPATTDGPYLEAKEHLAGYFVVDCDGPERAAEIAARFPGARFAAVEMHPIMSMSGQEM